MENCQKVYCLELESREMDASYILPLPCENEFYCKLTKKLCVANYRKTSFWTRQEKIQLNLEIVKRCPSRKTIENLLAKTSSD